MLSYHLHAVETQVAYEHKTGHAKIHHLKDLALESNFVAKPNDLNDAQVQAYQKTWTRRDTCGAIVSIKNCRIKNCRIPCCVFNGPFEGGTFSI